MPMPPHFIQPAARSSPCSQQPTTSHPLHTNSSYFRIIQCYTLLPSTPRPSSRHQRYHVYSQNKLLTKIRCNHHTLTMYRQWTYISKHSLSCRLHTPCNFRPGKELTVLTERAKVGQKAGLHMVVKRKIWLVGNWTLILRNKQLARCHDWDTPANEIKYSNTKKQQNIRFGKLIPV